MSDDEIAPEMLARLGINAIAMLWAQEFNKTAIKIGYSEMDEGWLTSWFVNAIENCDMMRRNPLRAELAAVTAERDRMQIAHDEAYIAGMKHGWNCCAAGDEERYKKSTENTREQISRARAALEGVTEPASPWRDIESAPKDGTYIDLWVNDERIPDARWNDCRRQWEVWGTGDYDRMEFIPIAGNPTHWMPLPEPPR